MIHFINSSNTIELLEQISSNSYFKNIKVALLPFKNMNINLKIGVILDNSIIDIDSTNFYGIKVNTKKITIT